MKSFLNLLTEAKEDAERAKIREINTRIKDLIEQYVQAYATRQPEPAPSTARARLRRIWLDEMTQFHRENFQRVFRRSLTDRTQAYQQLNQTGLLWMPEEERQTVIRDYRARSAAYSYIATQMELWSQHGW